LGQAAFPLLNFVIFDSVVISGLIAFNISFCFFSLVFNRRTETEPSTYQKNNKCKIMENT